MSRLIYVQDRSCFFFLLIFSCFEYLFEPHQYKYPKHVSLQYKIKYSCIICDQLLSLNRSFHENQIFIITNFVVVSSVGIKRLSVVNSALLG